jgi:hypothetical protein
MVMHSSFRNVLLALVATIFCEGRSAFGIIFMYNSSCAMFNGKSKDVLKANLTYAKLNIDTLLMYVISLISVSLSQLCSMHFCHK